MPSTGSSVKSHICLSAPSHSHHILMQDCATKKIPIQKQKPSAPLSFQISLAHKNRKTMARSTQSLFQFAFFCLMPARVSHSPFPLWVHIISHVWPSKPGTCFIILTCRLANAPYICIRACGALCENRFQAQPTRLPSTQTRCIRFFSIQKVLERLSFSFYATHLSVGGICRTKIFLEGLCGFCFLHSKQNINGEKNIIYTTVFTKNLLNAHKLCWRCYVLTIRWN